MRLLVYVVLLYLVYRLVRTLMTSGSQGKTNVGQIDDVMIKDPVCNVYFPQREGVHIKNKGKDIYFCSTQCRDTYLLNDKKE